jgi:hypothetical protein
MTPMNPTPFEQIYELAADTARISADLSDVLTAIAAAARLTRDAIERVEANALATASLIDGGQS